MIKQKIEENRKKAAIESVAVNEPPSGLPSKCVIHNLKY